MYTLVYVELHNSSSKNVLNNLHPNYFLPQLENYEYFNVQLFQGILTFILYHSKFNYYKTKHMGKVIYL